MNHFHKFFSPFDQFWVDFDHFMDILTHFWLKLAPFRPIWAIFVSFLLVLSHFWPFPPHFNLFGTYFYEKSSIKLGFFQVLTHFWVKFDTFRPIWIILVSFWPISGHFWPFHPSFDWFLAYFYEKNAIKLSLGIIWTYNYTKIHFWQYFSSSVKYHL